MNVTPIVPDLSIPNLRLGLIDIGNSNLKAAIEPLQDKSGNQAPDYLSNPTLLGDIRSLHWLPSGETSKPPPKEWMAAPDSWVVPQHVTAFRKLIERLRQDQKVLDNSSVHWKVSSVQPVAIETFQQCLVEFFPLDKVRLIERTQIPIQLDVESPERVGIDRLLAAWGAWKLHGNLAHRQPLIVIQAGTAVTLDWINERGIFCGGAIMPGLTLSLKYMALGTAHLPWLAPPERPSRTLLPGRNTQDAVLAGASASFLGGIQYLVNRYRSQWSHGDVPVVVSGGDGLFLADSLSQPFHVMNHLVLTALGCLK